MNKAKKNQQIKVLNNQPFKFPKGTIAKIVWETQDFVIAKNEENRRQVLRRDNIELVK